MLDAAARMLGVDHAGLSALALCAPAGADGLVLVPYLEGERTPNKPDATGALHGMRLANTTPAHLARAAVEGMLCALADGIDALRAQGVAVQRLFLVGGGAQSAAVREIAPSVLGLDVRVPTPGEYVADGAARQAAWVLSGATAPPRGAPPPRRPSTGPSPRRTVRAQYAAVRELTGHAPALTPSTHESPAPGAPGSRRPAGAGRWRQCAASYAALTSAEMRPRSDTWCPCSLAHSRMACASPDDERRPRGGATLLDVRPPTLRACPTHWASASRSSVACRR